MGLAASLRHAALVAAASAAAQAIPPGTGGASAGAAKQAGSRTPLPALGPRESVAGLQGFDAVSTLEFPSAPGKRHRLRMTYVFPDRARWQLTLGDEKLGSHEIRYRYGDACFLQREQSPRSEPCTGEERDSMRLAMELRRALVLYPDGFGWKPAGDGRRADLGEVGVLFARPASGTNPRPEEMHAETRDGKALDVYRRIIWRESGTRAWPASLEMWSSGEIVWRESIDSIDTQGRFIDAFFLPAELRESSGSAVRIEETRSQELPASCSLRVIIPKGTPWSEVAAGYARLGAEWAERLHERGLRIDDRATVEVTREGDAAAWIVRLEPVPDQPPPEFVTTPAGKGMCLAVRGLGLVTPEKLATLVKSLPAGTRSRSPYLRFDPRDSKEGAVLIVLPYSPARGG